ncbi:ras GTPase-activating-like protein IQGAP1 [Microplitis mediator]|uniref:ras GTPase-activating-like protein IQGAP1 n=1 Tax=Microplitis mediator TaxID=375433 RepID=UPI002552D0E2|nr:ras GTPase-activating-like protein IQGAP1 [Microplitis mediator]
MTGVTAESIIPNNGSDCRKSAEEMDEQRQKTLAYEYLCHLEEAKIWMEACLREKLPSTTELEENLRNGVYLAKLAHFMDPESWPLNKIYDIDQKRYKIAGLQFKHTDNINYFIECLKSMQLPLIFQPETTDIYDKKNMPRVIYCIHALSTHLFKLGKAPQIQDLYGKVNFTDAEIDTVSKELKKYGMQMPSFQKIGGLLLHSMAEDTAALHAAVIAINQVLTTSDRNLLLQVLLKPVAKLKNVNSELIDIYFETLSQAKEDKIEAAFNRSLNDSYIPDVYDELLTPAEIQGHINNVNSLEAFKRLIKSLDDDDDDDEFVKCLKNPGLQLQRISSKNLKQYKSGLVSFIESFFKEHDFIEDTISWQYLLQKEIDEINDNESKNIKIDNIVKSLNSALENNSQESFHSALMSPHLGISGSIDEFALPLYYEEMKIDRTESNCDICYQDILVSIRVLTAIASISKAIDTNNPDLVFEALSNPETQISNLDKNNKVKYYHSLATVRHDKLINNNNKCPILTYIDIQETIDLVNQQCQNDDKAIDGLRLLNKAVLENNKTDIIAALKNNLLDPTIPIMEDDAILYLRLFKQCLDEINDERSELWLEDVDFVSKIVVEEVTHVQNVFHVLTKINNALDDDDFSSTIKFIKSANFKIIEKHCDKYFEYLKNLKDYKKKEYNCSYICYVTPRGIEAFIDLDKLTYSWNQPKNITESHFITLEDIDEIVTVVANDEYNLSSDTFNQQAIINFQASARGYLLRTKMSQRLTYFYNNVDSVVKIQTWWRGIKHRRMYLNMLNQKCNEKCLKEEEEAAAEEKEKSKSIISTPAVTTDPIDYYKRHEDKIIKIQSFWRGRKARRAFISLLRMDKPPFPVVRHFSTVLNFNAEDYDKDLQLQQLKHDVVKTIKYNENLSQQLNSMDIKIGLLIQNRITLQDVIAHGKSLESLAKEKNNNRSRKNSFSEASTYKGLKSLTKEGRKMLEGYQHLFYALQTNPKYLAKLLFLLPQSKSNKFLQNVILTLYNFGSNIREEYLLLKLFGTALQEEIRSKFQKPAEVVTGNPLVLKMVVNYARKLNGQRALRQILGPVIEKVLADKTISIETNPVDIYKCWRNQLEMKTGESINLPYSVTEQQALNYEQVRNKLSAGIKVLKNTVLEFLKRITESRNLIPYGMLYISKVLYNTLVEKFPNAPEKDILKVVGNLIYYHFINAAIVAPDAFDIITLPIDESLSNDQRRNLASIAKILQFAASKKGFGEEATHLVGLNPFIIDCHEKFKNFFRSCCQIEELDQHFNIHEYTEATLIHKPEIYISIQEICDTHSLVLENQYDIAPDPNDQLHKLLDDLQPSAPTVATLMGVTDPICDSTLTRMGKTEVCLVLTNKFQVPDDDDQSLKKLFIKTKELLVSVIQFLKGDTLVSALESTSSPIQEKLYDAKFTNASVVTNTSIVYRNSSSLNDCKYQLRAYLAKLEHGKFVTRTDGYQSIITAVAKDLCNKGKYRMIRNKELQALRITRQRLQEKTKYYAEQVQYYNEYTQRCLENLHTGKGTLRAVKIQQKNSNNHANLKSKKTLKYSATKLSEKGVLLEIDGLTQGQFKNVTFEITPTEHSGLFTIKGKFMGVEMEKIEIDIQKLLELQFEGAPIMNLFDKAKINVNLLLYLLNRKFYGKT